MLTAGPSPYICDSGEEEISNTDHQVKEATERVMYHEVPML